MKEFKSSAIREFTPEEIKQKLTELREAQFKDRFKNTMRQLENSLKLREQRRAIARLETILREHELGVRKLGVQ
jgi:large subunit ribosomal protein L29